MSPISDPHPEPQSFVETSIGAAEGMAGLKPREVPTGESTARVCRSREEIRYGIGDE